MLWVEDEFKLPHIGGWAKCGEVGDVREILCRRDRASPAAARDAAAGETVRLTSQNEWAKDGQEHERERFDTAQHRAEPGLPQYRVRATAAHRQSGKSEIIGKADGKTGIVIEEMERRELCVMCGEVGDELEQEDGDIKPAANAQAGPVSADEIPRGSSAADEQRAQRNAVQDVPIHWKDGQIRNACTEHVDAEERQTRRDQAGLKNRPARAAESFVNVLSFFERFAGIGEKYSSYARALRQELMEERAEVFRNRRFDLDRRAIEIGKAQLVCMQRQARNQRPFVFAANGVVFEFELAEQNRVGRAVDRIECKGQADVGEVDADLMGLAGFGEAADEREAAKTIFDPPIGASGAAAVLHDGHASWVSGMWRDRRVDDAFIGLRAIAD